MNVTEIRMCVCEKWTCGVTRFDRIRNEYIRGSLGETDIAGQMRKNGFSEKRNL